MKKLLALILGSFVLSITSSSAAVGSPIVAWTFEAPNIPPLVVGTTVSGVLPSLGSGTASGFHANASTYFTNHIGNGSAKSWTAYYWTVGDYWQFQTSTLGFADLQLSFAQRSIFSGPTNFSLAISLDGTSFTTVLAQYNVRSDFNGGSWNSSTPNPNTVMTVDLSAFSQLDNAATVYFRLVAKLPGAGESRIDDFQVFATAIPEPSALAILSLGALLGSYRRHKTRRGLPMQSDQI